MHRQLRPLAALLAALLVAAPGLALAHGECLQQTVDGYTVTLALPERGFFTGRNPVAVSLWDWQGNAPEARVRVQALAFTPPADGHAGSHGAAADEHAAGETGGHNAGGHDAAATDGHAGSAHVADEAGHGHAGLALAPVDLAPSEELGEHRGELAFADAGTYSVSVAFSIDGAEHAALFDVAVAPRRPRGLVLGGFALVNAIAVGAAGWLKHRSPQKPARKPARPAASAAPEE